MLCVCVSGVCKQEKKDSRSKLLLGHDAIVVGVEHVEDVTLLGGAGGRHVVGEFGFVRVCDKRQKATCVRCACMAFFLAVGQRQFAPFFSLFRFFRHDQNEGTTSLTKLSQASRAKRGPTY